MFVIRERLYSHPVFSSVASLALPSFTNCLTNGKIFGKNLLTMKLMFWFSLSEAFIFIRIITRDDVMNVHRSSCKVMLFLPYFNETWIFSIDFLKLLKNKISEKSDWREPICSLRMDRQTDGQTSRRHEAISYFAQICERTYKWFRRGYGGVLAYPQNGIRSGEIAAGLTTGILNCLEIMKYKIRRYSTNGETQNTR